MSSRRFTRQILAVTMLVLGVPGLTAAKGPLDDAVAVWHMADAQDDLA